MEESLLGIDARTSMIEMDEASIQGPLDKA